MIGSLVCEWVGGSPAPLLLPSLAAGFSSLKILHLSTILPWINVGGSGAGGEAGVVNNGDGRRGLFQSGLVQSSSFLPVTV